MSQPLKWLPCSVSCNSWSVAGLCTLATGSPVMFADQLRPPSAWNRFIRLWLMSLGWDWSQSRTISMLHPVRSSFLLLGMIHLKHVCTNRRCFYLRTFFFFFFGVNNCSHRRHFPIILAHTHTYTYRHSHTNFLHRLGGGGVTCTSISAFSLLLRSACRGRHLNCMASTQTWWIDFPEHQLYLGAVVKSSHGVSCLCIVVGIVRVRAHLLFTPPLLAK